MTASLDVAEGVLLLAAAVGLLCSTLNLWDALRDLQVVRARNGSAIPTLALIARRDARSAAGQALAFLLFLVAVTVWHFWEAQTAAGWLATSAVVLLAAAAVGDLRVRSEVLLLADLACDDDNEPEGDLDEQPS